ncbi:MAG: glycoside hydrolase [Prolixibacteraceae bacterium]|jgi:hypothetical protein|nr:glycoside hydrolase [Prolixibacteraceae bacterium]
MKNIIQIICVLVFLLLSEVLLAESYYDEISLQGKWKFSIGDDMQWAEKKYDDTSWDNIYVPSRWEEQGYQGYNGFAWYRKNVVIPKSFQNRIVFIELGYIDDVDEVYFNGELIGRSGSFPPFSETAYNSFRRYSIPKHLININEDNTIAVRAFDSQLEGGIVRGNVRIVAAEIAIEPDINMNGQWDFNTGIKPNNSGRILVPGNWENQGFFNYDGFAVYYKTVNVSSQLANQKLIFIAGRIDDDDQLFINGKFIGETGDLNGNYNTDMHLEFRNYFIPEGVIKSGKNYIEIKVLDRGGEGGILEGTIGLISQKNFIKYWRMKRQRK